MLEIAVGDYRFAARLEEEAAPQTVAAFRELLPLESRLIHARWSGEACWIPFGGLDVGIGPENATSYPAPGELLLYPGGISETELLFPYGSTCFASRAGQLAGNHFATVVEGAEELAGPRDVVTARQFVLGVADTPVQAADKEHRRRHPGRREHACVVTRAGDELDHWQAEPLEARSKRRPRALRHLDRADHVQVGRHDRQYRLEALEVGGASVDARRHPPGDHVRRARLDRHTPNRRHCAVHGCCRLAQ